jgi:hypothetical protein
MILVQLSLTAPTSIKPIYIVGVFRLKEVPRHRQEDHL